MEAYAAIKVLFAEGMTAPITRWSTRPARRLGETSSAHRGGMPAFLGLKTVAAGNLPPSESDLAGGVLFIRCAATRPVAIDGVADALWTQLQRRKLSRRGVPAPRRVA